MTVSVDRFSSPSVWSSRVVIVECGVVSYLASMSSSATSSLPSGGTQHGAAGTIPRRVPLISRQKQRRSAAELKKVDTPIVPDLTASGAAGQQREPSASSSWTDIAPSISASSSQSQNYDDSASSKSKGSGKPPASGPGSGSGASSSGHRRGPPSLGYPPPYAHSISSAPSSRSSYIDVVGVDHAGMCVKR